MQDNSSPTLRVSNEGLPDRDPGLDGLRGLAILLVVIGHVAVFLPYGLLLSLLHFTTNSFQIGLDLFFVLSGYLITAILIRTREDRAYFRNFYIRRVLRIFPIYYLLLVFCFFVRPLLPGGAPPWQQSLDKEAAWFFLYAQNLAMAWRGEGIGWGGLLHTFSLAIEEQFYLLWPLLVWLVPLRRLLHVCLAVIAASLTYKTWMWLNGASWWYLYVDTLTRVHALAAGGAVAAWLIVHKGTMPRWLPAAALVAIVSIPFIIVAAAMGAISNIDFIVLLNDVAPVLFVWMLMSLIMSPPQQPLRRFLERPVMVLLGRYSYGLYLVHQPILYEVHRVLLPIWEPVMGVHAAGILCGLIGLSMAMPLAVVLYHVFELPILGLKRHFKPERPRQSAQEVSMSQASNQAMKNKFKSITGEIYNPLDAQYLRDSTRCHDLCMKLNAIPDRRRRKRRRAMARIFGQEVRAAIRSPFYCDFGTNITLGDGVFISFNCIVLDTARVTIGDRSLFGPGIQILTAAHPTDPDERRTGRISARPITIGADVWVGAGAIICPGVTVGDGAVIGAGSVVTRSIPSNVFAAGNPCRVIRSLRE